MLIEKFQALRTINFEAYNQALSEVRKALDAGQKSDEISTDDLFFMMRPYYWFLHNPGFQDIMDNCEAAMQVMQSETEFLMKETNPMIGNEFLAVARFLTSYLNDGIFDPSEWRMLFGSPEISTHTTAKKYAEQLEAAKKPGAATMQALSDLMFEIESAKHVCYWALRHIAVDFIDFIERLIHTIPSGDQTYILHAMDAFPGNPAVIDFYKNFIAKTNYDSLKKEAEKYLQSVDV